MASLTLRLRVDPATGKKDVIIDYESDADALPMEHEEEHRRLVEQAHRRGALRGRASWAGWSSSARRPARKAAAPRAATGNPQRARPGKRHE